MSLKFHKEFSHSLRKIWLVFGCDPQIHIFGGFFAIEIVRRLSLIMINLAAYLCKL